MNFGSFENVGKVQYFGTAMEILAEGDHIPDHFNRGVYLEFLGAQLCILIFDYFLFV
jgi:hypothetical protein